MKEKLLRFEEKPPEVVFEWHDSETEAKGWVVINSLRGGAAGGGTRMRQGLTKHEVLSLAKTMEIKFLITGPAIGGAKSGIDFNPNDPRKEGVLKRWFEAISPLLRHYYGTGGDLNVDQKKEVIPITSKLGITHPQEGVLQGHYNPKETEKRKKIDQLQTGVSLLVEDPQLTPSSSTDQKVGDLITGYGTAESVRHFYQIHGESLKGKRVLIQGWGNVAAAAAFYLAQAGAKIVGIIDRVGGVTQAEGFSFDEIRDFYNKRSSNFLVADDLIPFEQANEQIWSVGAEVFIPAAASRLITLAQLNTLLANGLEVISAGANVPFSDEEIFYGAIAEEADMRCSVIPDFISNCGMARVFGYLMTGEALVQDSAIFRDVSTTIYDALHAIYEENPLKTGITRTAYEIVLRQLI